MIIPESGGSNLPPLHWRGDDGRIHELTFQGHLLTWKVRQPPSVVPPTKKRGKVIGFSRASRLRILKLIETINWTLAEPCLFITLTYPDMSVCGDKDVLNSHRDSFCRKLERRLKKQTPVLWRLEWQDRKTGECVGEIMPHFHMIVFQTPFIDCNEVNECWKKTIGHDGYVRTETKGMDNSSMAAAYVAKYAAKPTDSSLVDAAYLGVGEGRQWGIKRKDILPMHEKEVIRLTPSDIVEQAREIATKERPWLSVTGYESFSVWGDAPHAVYNFLRSVEFDGSEIEG